jgi:hypothetical protein
VGQFGAGSRAEGVQAGSKPLFEFIGRMVGGYAVGLSIRVAVIPEPASPTCYNGSRPLRGFQRPAAAASRS